MKFWIPIAFSLIITGLSAQTGVAVRVFDEDSDPAPMASVRTVDSEYTTDFEGRVIIPVNEVTPAIIRLGGYTEKHITLIPDSPEYRVVLERKTHSLDQVVVTASRTHLDRRESPIAVQVLGQDLLKATQSVSAAEGLSYRPGLRVEYNCQNCGFSQVRLNGLDGPYTQILIDGRPVFSALSGVYGLEQIPTSMIERVEVVRGGGSSLYGANAIAGTINIITREPIEDEWEIKGQTTLNGLRSPDHSLQGSVSRINEKNGTQAWFSGRWRNPFNANPDDMYDRDNDGIADTEDDFSEITQLKAAAGGVRYWHRLSSRERLEVEGRGLYEFRRGGNRFDYAPHESDITEQLIHKTGGLNAQYEWMSEDGHSRFSAYAAGTITSRESYYGAGGNDPDSAIRAQARLYYGDTRDEVANIGGLYAYRISLRHSLIAGIDVQYNHVNDNMPGYGRSIDQSVLTPAVYAQWRWTLNESWTAELGARYDRPTVKSANSFADDVAWNGNRTFNTVNPRISLLYKPSEHLRFRAGFATGFRAPQAFDEDLHLSTLGGSARISTLSENLTVEKSNSWNAGAEWDYHLTGWEGRIAVDGFYTRLIDPFIDQPFTGAVIQNGDTIALLDTKVNDPDGAHVGGVNIETEWRHARWTVQAGYTLQTAVFSKSREWYPQAFSNRILRAPSHYGYAILGYVPGELWRFDVSATFTGPMITPNERLQTLVETPFFADVNISVQRSWKVNGYKYTTEIGVYNLLNQYQSDLETGWNRDASYFYGPLRPLSIYAGFSVGI